MPPATNLIWRPHDSVEKSGSATGKTPLLQSLQGLLSETDLLQAYPGDNRYGKHLPEWLLEIVNIMDGIGDTSITWEEVTIQCMSGLGQK